MFNKLFWAIGSVIAGAALALSLVYTIPGIRCQCKPYHEVRVEREIRAELPHNSEIDEKPIYSPSERSEPYRRGLLNRIFKTSAGVQQMAFLPALDLKPFDQNTYLAARQENRPVFVRFTADFCTQCKAEWWGVDVPKFQREANRLGVETFIVDVEDITAIPEEVQSLMTEHSIRGFPAYLFIDRDGKAFTYTSLNLLWPTSNLIDGLQELA